MRTKNFNCIVCHKHLTKFKKFYCSLECANYKPPRLCLKCKNPLPKFKSKFCSLECLPKYNKSRPKPKPKIKQPSRARANICGRCLKRFISAGCSKFCYECSKLNHADKWSNQNAR